MSHALSVDIRCPMCEETVAVLLRPDPPAAGFVIESIEGCPHAEELHGYLGFETAVLEAVAELEGSLRDDADNDAVDRLRDAD